MSINGIFSSTLYHRRIDLGYTQKRVADDCNISLRQYQSLETGHSLPTLVTALRLSIVLDFSLETFKSEVAMLVLPVSHS